MRIKKILVVVDGSATSLARLESGFNLAKNLNSTVTALCVIPSYGPSIGVGTMHGGWYVGEEVVENQRRKALVAAKEVQEACNRLSKNFVSNLNWIQKEGSIADIACSESQYHDILLLGKPDTVNEPELQTADLDKILLSCGKPVVVLAGSTPRFSKIPENILFAWDRSREAVHAMNQAMPFLENASSVMVVSAYKHIERLKTIKSQAKDMSNYLRDHDINASSHALPTEHRSTGELFSHYAEESETDLIVMGAYGHSRLSELILGGTTRYMLQHATHPVLFAH